MSGWRSPKKKWRLSGDSISRPFRSFSENEIMVGRPKKEGSDRRQATGGVSNVGDELTVSSSAE